MASTEPFFLKFRDFVKSPTLELAKIVNESINEDAVREISFMGHEDLVLTSLLTAIAELNVRNKNEIKTQLIETAATFIAFSRIKKLVSMQTILMILLKQIGVGPTYTTIQSNLSEEFKLAVMKCFSATFRRALSSVIEEFYTKNNLSLIAYILSISQFIIANETYRPLRMAGIECTLSVQQLHDAADKNDIVLRRQIADIVFILLPKILSTLTNVATGDEILGEPLIMLSIDALGRIICLIFEDEDDNSGQSIIEQTKILITNSLKMTEKIPDPNVLKLPKRTASLDDNLKEIQSKQRSSDWLAAASLKILPIIQRLHNLTGCKSNKIHKKLYEFSELLLRRCQKNLASCVAALLEINITLCDEMTQRSTFLFDENVIDLAEKQFVDHLIRLVRIAHTGDEDEQMANIRLLRGFVRILCDADRLKITLSNQNNLEKFITVLLSMVELERSIKLLEENNNIYDLSERDSKNVQSLVLLRDNTPWKIYNNLRNSKLINEIASVCKCLSADEVVNVFLLEYLLKILSINSINCNEALVIIQMLAASQEKSDLSESIHISIVEELLRDFRWNLATEINDQPINEYTNRTWFHDRTDGLYESATTITLSDIKPMEEITRNESEVITIKDLKNNILHMCLTIETIGMYAIRFGEQYQKFMLRSFHRLLEKSASIHYMIRVAGLIALNCVKEAFGLSSISQLIFNNADYVTHSINVSLKKSDQIDVSLRILSIVLHYSSVESLPHLENICETIIAESAKLSHTNNVLSFMRAFNLILSTIRESLAHSTEMENLPAIEMVNKNNTSYLDIWRNILHDVDITEEETNENDENDEPMETEGEITDEKEPKPPLVILSINIIKRTIPYFGDKNQEIKLSALDCLTIGLDIIKDYEDDLLPIVHLIWEPFINQCIRDTSPVVLRYCIRLLSKLALYAKDFIYKRSADQLLPHINAQMNALSKKCIAEKHQFLYEHTQEFKLIKELLISLPEILICLKVHEKDLDNVLNAIIWLLDKNQPQQLQIHCIDFMKKCSTFDICAVYVKLLKYSKDDRFKWNCQKVLPNQFN